jgi:ABC-type Na+ efflux pump permease subunit
MRSILNRFLDSMGGFKIALNVFMDEANPADYALTGQFVQRYMHSSLALNEDLEGELLDVRAPSGARQSAEAESQNVLLSILTPIMSGMMVFYAFFTGTSTAQSILKEEEERTLPRLFTTPTPQVTILAGKLLSVFLTVCAQVIVLLIAARLIFGIHWGEFVPVALIALGIIFSASSFGIFVNSFLRDTKQAGVVFGGVLTVTGMIGMVSILVPQGWAVRGLLQSVNAEPIGAVLVTVLVMLAWSVAFFVVGVLRFNKRYV